MKSSEDFWDLSPYRKSITTYQIETNTNNLRFQFMGLYASCSGVVGCEFTGTLVSVEEHIRSCGYQDSKSVGPEVIQKVGDLSLPSVVSSLCYDRGAGFNTDTSLLVIKVGERSELVDRLLVLSQL